MGAAPRERIPKRVRTASVRRRPAAPTTPCATLCRLLIDPRMRIMLDPKLFEDFSQRLSTLLAGTPAADLEKNVKAMLSGFFTKLDLVTREEFDVQAQVLARTRAKLEALEARVTALENPPAQD